MAEPSTSSRLATLCRLILVFRLLTLLVSVLYLPAVGRDAPLVLGALVVATGLSYLPLRFWERLAPTLEAHPLLLGFDLILAQGLLLATGVHGPFFLYTVSCALLAGVVYRRRGATVFSVLLLGIYYAIVGLRASQGQEAPDFQTLVGAPMLYPFAAAGGAAIRRLLDREARAEADLTTERERARVAREMHDSLGKTLYGLGLSASAVAREIERAPQRAREGAQALAAAAQEAGDQARALIGGLRADQASLDLTDAVRHHVEDWSRRTEVGLEARLEEGPPLSPDGRYELFAILREALENIERHASSRLVIVVLESREEGVCLQVRDDGVGMSINGDLEAAEPAGHFGLIGMRERAERLGGAFSIASAPGMGTSVIATIPVSEREERSLTPARRST